MAKLGLITKQDILDGTKDHYHFPDQNIWMADVKQSETNPDEYTIRKPEYGILALSDNPDVHNAILQQQYNENARNRSLSASIFPNNIIYFAPSTHKYLNRIDWSRVVKIDSQFFASNEYDIWAIFTQKLREITETDPRQTGEKSPEPPETPLYKAIENVFEESEQFPSIFTPQLQGNITTSIANGMRRRLELDRRRDNELQDVIIMAKLYHDEQTMLRNVTPEKGSAMWNMLQIICKAVGYEEIRRRGMTDD